MSTFNPPQPEDRGKLCLYCSKKLPFYTRDTYFECPQYEGGRRETMEAFEARVSARCEAEDLVVTSRREGGHHVNLRKREARRGVFGEGFFHSGECAKLFGLQLARLGRVLVRRES